MTEKALSTTKSAENMRKWIAKPGNLERKREMNRKYYAKIRDSGLNSQKNREHIRFRKHGTSRDAFIALIEEQGGGCAICQEPGTWETLVVDHDHSCCDAQFSCGKCIRGALCRKCNTAIGLFEDDLELMGKAASYLKSTEVANGA